MAKENGLVVTGEVMQNLGPGGYAVRVPELGLDVTATVGGKMRQFKISILPWDSVDVELSPYEPTKWRITYRHGKSKPKPPQDSSNTTS